MDTRRLALLLHLSRAGSMRAVADERATSTSTVSQQLAALAHEVGTPLLESEGRGVRLTPAGHRLADHAVTILAAVEAARLDLDPGAEPAGEVRVAGFATAVRRSVVPLVTELATDHPDVTLAVHEHEPGEALAMLERDAVDLALVYDYDLAPLTVDPAIELTALWSTRWGLGVPSDAAVAGPPPGDSPTLLSRHRDAPWIVNSRGTADEQAVRTLASMAGFAPRVTHRVDSLDLVQDLVAAGLGVALLPMDQPVRPDLALLALDGPPALLRCYAAVRRGRAAWAPLALVREALTRSAGVASYP